MPELPDIIVYIEALERRIVGRRLQGVRLLSPFLLRSVDPTPSELVGRLVVGLRRLGKRIVIELEGECFLVLHLMVAGRLQWSEVAEGAALPKVPKRRGLAAFDFSRGGTLILTEAGTKKRASLHCVRGEAALREHDRGGLEILDSDRESFERALRSENHTLKRALTDPRLFSGVGNAYSDEILLRARLSPMQWTTRLDDEEVERLYRAAREILVEWTERLRHEAGESFPTKVTAFRAGMGAHGRFREPCPQCGQLIQRIVYAENESNYCARCQTGGRLLADRALSRLLRDDWPRSLEQLDELWRKGSP